MHSKLNKIISLIDFKTIGDIRKEKLQALIDYINSKRASGEPVRLNFICTHNSRRSQFAQLWADAAALKYNIAIDSYSGGVEITECNPRTIKSLQRFGFEVNFEEQMNPRYQVSYSPMADASILFSKLFDDKINPSDGFAAIMTCSHADQNCPFVNGCETRISLTYDDPKHFDDSPIEDSMYDSRSFQIATEMMYVFSEIK